MLLLAMSLSRFTLAMVSLHLIPAHDAFKLLDVGAPRTGTQSLHDAMEILGFNSMHTGSFTPIRVSLCEYLFGNGPLEDAIALLGAFDAAMDEPVMLMYEEVMAAFPEAKFLLTLSDAESWFNSTVELARTMSFNRAVMSVPDPLDELDRNSWKFLCSGMKSWGCNFENSSAEEKETCLQNYARHNERVQEVIPPERLLVYNWSDGWAPLAHFLGTAIPEEEFPHEDAVKSRNEEREVEALRSFGLAAAVE